MTRIYIAGSEARTLRRMSRRSLGVRLIQDENSDLEPFGRRWTQSDACELETLKKQLGLLERDVTLRVPSHATRVRAKGLSSSITSVALPNRSFDRLEVGEGCQPLELPTRFEVCVDSAPLSFVDSACRLTRLVATERMSSLEADLRLLKLGFEECSTYALDPWLPGARPDATEVPRATSVSDLLDYLSALHGMSGIVRARRVAPLLLDNAASQMESFLAAALSLPPSMGGLGLERPELNKVQPLDSLQRLRLNHVRQITPDLLWEAIRIIIEYLGHEPHEGGAAQDEDAGRIQDYQVLGYAVFPVRYKHISTPQSFNRLALRLARTMERCGRQGTVAWMEELLKDEEFLQRQRVLFMVMLPPVCR